MSDARLPDAWVEALLSKFKTVWGAQKFGVRFRPDSGEDLQDWSEDLHNLWATQLAAFSGATLKAALQAAIDSGSDWPPTLPEFKALCRQFNRPEHSAVPMLTNGGSVERTEAGERHLEIARSVLAAKDPMCWAKFPASRNAVELLVRGAELDHRLRDILRAHLQHPTVRDGHKHAAEALAALRELADNPPRYLEAA